MVYVIAVALAVLWVLIAAILTLFVGAALFVGEVIGQFAPANQSVTLLGSITMTLVGYRLAWLLFDRPSSGVFLGSLIAALAVLVLGIALRLVEGNISSSSDLLLFGFIVVVSGLGLRQTR